MAFINISITKKYGVFISCEKCGAEDAIDRMLFDVYPARLCHKCTRQFEFDTKDNGEFRALIFAKKVASDPNKLEIERNSALSLYLDIQKGLKPFLDDWLTSDI